MEILEARAALEGLVARHAAVNADEQGVDELRAILAEMLRKREDSDFVGVSNVNARVHARILELSTTPLPGACHRP